MPYIKQKRRDEFEFTCPSNQIEQRKFKTSGELNYGFTTLLKKYIEVHGLSYQSINDIIGALEGAKLEFYRRVAAPYEDVKIKENGDVY